MGFNLKIKGKNEEINLGMDNITTVKYLSDTPDDSNARASDLGVILEVNGKIITPVNGEEADDTKKMAKWSLIPAESSDAYRELTLEVISGSVVVRKIDLPNAFILDYSEDYNDKGGVGEFKAIFKQKKEKIETVTIEGGYAAEE
ncbi:membrane-associated protease 1 [Fusobacterium sp.]|uniref:membrane-associated protease 1 n=1 Tax=Fusobacterium sp. TaxID=68766 RepID=UPI002902404B|nr:membrane-associated protease 1 [Fusobacterium sp.]MDU1911595.1 membrane-associated protease 1 [Fusobacterium sp.]